VIPYSHLAKEKTVSGGADTTAADNEGIAVTEKPDSDRAVRPRRRAYLSAEERKKQILRAATEAFSRSSLHGVSTREIAQAADINPATLFEHFGSKEALFREAVIAPLLKELREMKSRVTVYQAASRDRTSEVALTGVQKQMGVMKRLFPLFTTALFSDLDAGKALYREHFVPFIEERKNLMRGLANSETDPYFLQLATLGILFIVAMEETFGDGRMTRALAAKQFINLIEYGTAPRPHAAASTRHPVPGSQLHDRNRLGNSDLWVSPLALEAADFAGNERDQSTHQLQELLDIYIARGGNFVETTNYFGGDQLEEMVVRLVRERRDEVVLACNHRLLPSSSHPRRGGTFRFRFVNSVEETLKRLGVECIDLLFVDRLDPGVQAAEVVDAYDDLIKTGKIRYGGFSDMPAWQMARIHTIAEARGRSPFVALRVPYGISSRSAERDVLPMAYEMGLGVTTFTRLPALEPADDDPIGPPLLDVFDAIAAELGKTRGQVALAWKFLHPGVSSALIHPHGPEQLMNYIDALQIIFTENQIERLESIARRPDS
jgi:aryl-alcohol dehydrogenase-like predicted oxidoreductase